jgi:hypothetical protein
VDFKNLLLCSTETTYEVKTRFQAFAFKCNLYRYNEAHVAERLVDEMIDQVQRERVAEAEAAEAEEAEEAAAARDAAIAAEVAAAAAGVR